MGVEEWDLSVLQRQEQGDPGDFHDGRNPDLVEGSRTGDEGYRDKVEGALDRGNLR